MKTSNKILLGAFLLFVIVMIVANTMFKNKVEEIKAKQNNFIQETDTAKQDSTSSISIKIN